MARFKTFDTGSILVFCLPVFGSISFNQSVPLLISQNGQLLCENVAFNFKYITLMKA